MRWMIGVVVLAVTAGAWAQGKPATPVLDDPTAMLQLLEQERKMVRERLADVGAKLDVIRAEQAQEKDEEKRNAMLRKSQVLNDLRNLDQIRLNELNEQLRVRKSQQLRQAFGEECDLFLAEPAPSGVTKVRFVGVVDVDGQRMLQFTGEEDGPLWTIDPRRIAAVRVTIPAAGK